MKFLSSHLFPMLHIRAVTNVMTLIISPSPSSLPLFFHVNHLPFLSCPHHLPIGPLNRTKGIFLKPYYLPLSPSTSQYPHSYLRRHPTEELSPIDHPNANNKRQYALRRNRNNATPQTSCQSPSTEILPSFDQFFFEGQSFRFTPAPIL